MVRAAPLILTCVALAAAFVGQSASSAEAARAALRTVPSVDLARYAGRWYEIARLPNRFQKQCAGEVTADYTLGADRRVEVINRCQQEDGKTAEARGVARLPDPSKTAELEVRFAPAFLSFLPFVWGDYWIVDLAPDYSYAAVGEPSRELFWILSRTPELPETTYREIVARAAAQDFNESRMVKTRQSASAVPSN